MIHNMAYIFNGNEIKDYSFNDDELKSKYFNDDEVFRSGAIITYMVDTATPYTEEVDSGASALSPTTFTPTKPGWTFAGWREDTTANGSVLTSKTCEGEPFTLYAVFKRVCTLTCVSYNKTDRITADAYYNNGNVKNAVVTTPQVAAYSGWTIRGWSLGFDNTAADASVWKKGGEVGDIDTSDYTVYGLYSQDVTLTYYDNSTTAKTKPGTRYYNATGNTKNPSFKMTQAASTSGMTARGWSTSNVGNATVNYANGATITLTGNLTIYGMYEQALTLTYYDNSTTAKTKGGTKYWAPAGYIYPSFKLAQASKSGWSARGWSGSNAAAGSIAYQNNTDFSISSNTTIYGCYEKTCTCTFKSYNSSVDREGKAYYNSSGNEQGASVTAPNGASYSGWSWRGWSTGGATAADAAVTFANGASVGLGTSSHTVYGLYQQTITLKYYEKEKVTDSKTGTRYWNAAGNYKNPTFSFSLGALSGWTAIGWGTSSSATAGKVYESSTSNLELSANLTIYGLYQQTITLSYNGNGATGGSVSAHTGTRKYNSAGNYSNPSFTLKANGFTLIDHNFSGWDLGAAGASVTLSANATAKAQWTRIPAEPFYLSDQGPSYTHWYDYGTQEQLVPNANFGYWQLITTQGGGNEWARGYSLTSAINRRHCTKCKFTVYSLSGSSNYIQVGNTQYAITDTGGTANAGGGRDHVFDISGEAESVQVKLFNQTGGSDSSIQITNPYFY